MRMAQFALIFMGFREDQLHKENFVVNTRGESRASRYRRIPR